MGGSHALSRSRRSLRRTPRSGFPLLATGLARHYPSSIGPERLGGRENHPVATGKTSHAPPSSRRRVVPERRRALVLAGCECRGKTGRRAGASHHRAGGPRDQFDPKLDSGGFPPGFRLRERGDGRRAQRDAADLLHGLPQRPDEDREHVARRIRCRRCGRRSRPCGEDGLEAPAWHDAPAGRPAPRGGPAHRGCRVARDAA